MDGLEAPPVLGDQLEAVNGPHCGVCGLNGARRWGTPVEPLPTSVSYIWMTPYLIEKDHFKGDERKNVHYQTMFDTVLSPNPLFQISFHFLLARSWPSIPLRPWKSFTTEAWPLLKPSLSPASWEEQLDGHQKITFLQKKKEPQRYLVTTQEWIIVELRIAGSKSRVQEAGLAHRRCWWGRLVLLTNSSGLVSAQRGDYQCELNLLGIDRAYRAPWAVLRFAIQGVVPVLQIWWFVCFLKHTQKKMTCIQTKREKSCCCAPASTTELSLLGFVQTKSPGSTLDVGVVPPISGDPMPHGLCSSPTLQWGSAPHGCCIPCHKSTFLHNGGTQEWSVHSGSRWVGCRSDIVEFQTSPSASSKHPYWWRCFPKAGWDIRETWSSWRCLQDTARVDKWPYHLCIPGWVQNFVFIDPIS